MKSAVSAGAIASVLTFLLSACTSDHVDIGYAPELPIQLSADESATFDVGQFTDQRDEKPHWVGEVRGTLPYPKTSLVSDRTVADLVQDLFEQGAFDRGMLKEGSDSSPYQLYGQITRVDGIEADTVAVHVHLVSRLIDRDTNKQIYEGDHKAERTASLRINETFDVGTVLEEVLNQVVSASLDDPKLREVLLSLGQES